jgi:hypothetical protein
MTVELTLCQRSLDATYYIALIGLGCIRLICMHVMFTMCEIPIKMKNNIDFGFVFVGSKSPSLLPCSRWYSATSWAFGGVP